MAKAGFCFCCILPSRELLRLDSNLFVLYLYLYLYVPAEGFQFHTFQPAASVNVLRLSRAFSSVSHSHCHTPPASEAKPSQLLEMEKYADY
jgi:hypothetical protein